MTNRDTRTLLEIMKEKSPDSKHISQLMEDFNDRKITLIKLKFHQIKNYNQMRLEF